MSKQPIYENPNDDTSPIIGYGPFIPEKGGIYDGQYVDLIYSEEDKNAITTGTGTQFHDAAIIPTVQYQVYGLDNVWFWDDEGQNYSGSKGSEIMIQAVLGTRKSYYGVETTISSPSTEPTPPTPQPIPGTSKETRVTDVGDGVLPTEPDQNDGVGDKYYKENGNNEYDVKTVEGTMDKIDEPSVEQKSNAKEFSTPTSGDDPEPAPLGSKDGDVYYKEEEVLDPPTEGDGAKGRTRGSGSKSEVEKSDEDPGDENEGEDTEEISAPYEFNKYLVNGNTAVVTIKPSKILAELYPFAIVTINGKEYDLKYLDKPLRLVMDKDYRISINWVWGSVVETFRINRNQ